MNSKMNSKINITMGLTEWLFIILLSVLWGAAFFMGKVAVTEIPPFTIVFGRTILGAAILNGVVIASGQRLPRQASLWGAFLVVGLLNNIIPFSLIYWGQIRIGSGLASILNATTPLWTVVLAHFLTRDEKMTVSRLGGVLFGLVGVVVLIGPAALFGLGLNVIAQLVVLGGSLSFAIAGIYGRRFQNEPPLITATGALTCSAIIAMLMSLVIDRPWRFLPYEPATVWSIVGMGVLSTALAYAIYYRVLATVGATNLLLSTFLIPVSAALLGMAFLDERLDPRHFIGMALIGVGLAAIDGRLLTLLRPPTTPKVPPVHRKVNP
jgi:drug/metabolite transporter (DMT)-like permease